MVRKSLYFPNISKDVNVCCKKKLKLINHFCIIIQGPPLGPGQGNVLPGQDNLNALQRAIDSMEEKGLQEDPRYSQLIALRANSKQNPNINQNQMQLLRAQIMAYRSLARNQPLSKQIQSVIAGKLIKRIISNNKRILYTYTVSLFPPFSQM